MPDARPLLLAVDESDSTLRLRLAGDFDLQGVGPVEHALDRLCEAPAPRRVVFDLRGLAFLGLAGLRTILRTDAQGRAEAFEVVVVRPRGTANRVFTLTRVGERLSLVDELEAAMAARLTPIRTRARSSRGLGARGRARLYRG